MTAGGSSRRPARDPLKLVGNTPVVELHRLAPRNGSRLLLKIEAANPTGSMKDRMALAMIEAARQDRRLEDDGSVVEYTGGSTGVSLAFVCAVRGIPIEIVSSDAFARDKLDLVRFFGARVEIIESDRGQMTGELTRAMIERARELARRPGVFWTDQLRNRDPIAAYGGLGEELWAQSGERVDAFVQSVGTAGSIRGVGAALRSRNPAVEIVAVEPSESPVLSGGESGGHRIEGVGAGFVVPLWQEGTADRVELVSTADAVDMAFRLAREEGIAAGTSTGANLVASFRVAERLGPSATVATLMCDSGMKYLGTDLFSDALSGELPRPPITSEGDVE